ncbi:MAG: MBG domain-containing protein [Chloroflexota bacterium]
MSEQLRSMSRTMKKVNRSPVSVGIRFAVLILVFAWSLVGMNTVAVTAAGTTYYVDNTNPACSDAGPGTSAVPYCTLAKGASVASIPGDTVHVLAGTYAETVFVNYSGVDGSPITFHANPGVTVTGDPAGFGSAFAVSAKSYVVIDGFNITETKYKGIYVDSSSHITVSNNHVTYAGINAGYDQHQQGIFIRNTTYSLITGNVADHNSCIGIRLINGSDYNTVSNNISFANSSTIAWPVVAISDAAGIEVTGSSHNLVVNNIVYGNEDTGINLYVNSSGVGSSNNVVVGNLSYGNGDHGIDNNASPYNTIIGNTVHGNGTTGINFEGEVGAGSHHATVMNNITAGNGLTPPAGSFGGNLRVDSNSISGTVLDYNLFNKETATVQIIWNNSSYTSLAAFRVVAPTQEVHGLEGNPLFVSPVASVLRTSGEAYPSSTTTGDYHIDSGSPAIDSANSDAPNQMSVDIEGYARVDDPATTNTGAGTRAYDDRGAYEYQPSGLEAPPTVTTQAVTGIAQTSAVGNGNIVSLGVPNPTQHGVVWSTSANPTTADEKTEEGPVSETGAFTSIMTGLVPGTLYHVRAYATNAVSTAYGGDVTFTTDSADSITFTTSGTWVAPAGVNTVTVEVWGGGGRGGSISGGYGEAVAGGGGGGGYSRKTITVVPGTSYAYVVGAGSTSTSPGGDSYFINTSTVLAKGGNSSTGTNGASGGAAASGIGDVKYSGGAGANGSSSSNRGGGGGSSAGIGATGTTATDGSGAVAPSGGGDGGDARSGSSGNGSAGSTPGGAGGGAYRSNYFSSYSGGNGARGQVRITYYVSTTPTTTSVNCGAGTPSVAYGSDITCVATVTAASGTTSPSGTVSWSTTGSGAFATSPCTLSGTGGSATCSVTYTPGSVGTGSHLITANYAGDSNFLASSGNQTVTVTKLAASVTPDAASKVYGDIDPVLTGILTGFLPADGITATYSRVAGETVADGPYAISATLAPVGVLDNYTITYNTADFTITPKAASVTPDPATKVYGDADPALSGTLTGFLPADAVTATYSRAAGETVLGGPYAISATLAPAGVLGNYAITYNTANFTITPKAASVTPNVATKVYGAADPTLTGTLTGFLPADAVTATYIRTAGETVAGSPYTISATLAPAGVLSNYTITYNTANFTITQKAASVTPNALSKVYGAVDPTLTGTLTGFLPADGVTATYTRVAGETVAGGPYAISATLAPAGVLGNYTITYNTANFTITPKTASVTPNAASKVYGSANPALTGTLSGFLPADGVTATYTRTAGETVAGSPYTISATLAPAGVLGNYTITYNTANFTITPKSLTITGVTAQNKTYDRTTAATLNLGGATLVGVIAPDVVTIDSSGATGTFASANAGLRTVTASGFGLSGAAAGNYVLAAQPTVPDATINPKPVTANGVKANNKVYDRAANVISFDLSGASLTGVIAPDVASVDASAATGLFASANAGTWHITVAGFGVTNTNYVLSAQPTVPDATITPKGVTIIGVVAYNKIYDQTTVATFNLSGASLVGVIAPDPVTIDSSAATGAFASPNAIQSAVTASGFALAGTGGNYVLTAQPIVPDATIIPRMLTVDGITANDKPYDGNTTASLNLAGATLVGVLSGDDVTLDTSAAAGTFASANVGTWTVTVSGLTLDGTAKNNYSLTQPTTTASILGATASVTGIVANDKTYDGDIAATLDYSGATLVGIVPGDDVTLDTSGAVAEFDDANVGTGKTVTISGLALSGDDAGKYLLTQPPASSADITARDLTVTAVASDKPYDGTTTATVTLSTDALAGDEVTTSFTGANFDTSDVGVGKTVTVEGIAIAGADAGNYNLLNTTATDTADITAADVTVTANNQTKIVGQADPVFTYTATGFVGTDTFVVEPVCSVADPHDVVGTYVITCTGGEVGSNYVIASYVDGTLSVTEIPIQTLTLRSVAAQDGWILESTETSGVGGTLNTTATTFNLGDDAADKQYRAVLSFNTAGLPDNAIIKSVTLRIRKQSLVGTDPFSTHGKLLAEIRKPYFGTNAALVATDFQAAANKTGGLFGITPVNNWYSVAIGAASFPFVNLTGTTQFRLRFQKDDNDDRGADYMKFFSGNYATASVRPTLIIQYTVP